MPPTAGDPGRLESPSTEEAGWAGAGARHLGRTHPDAPPKRAPGRPKGPKTGGPGVTADASPLESPKRPPGRPSKPKLGDKLGEQVGALGLLLLAVAASRGDPRLIYDGQVVIANAQRLGAALDKATLENPAVRRMLESLVMASAWGEVFGALLAIGIPVLANHGILPRDAAAMFAEGPPPEPAMAAGPLGPMNGFAP